MVVERFVVLVVVAVVIISPDCSKKGIVGKDFFIALKRSNGIIGFLKKLPAFPTSFGSGSFDCLILIIALLTS